MSKVLIFVGQILNAARSGHAARACPSLARALPVLSALLCALPGIAAAQLNCNVGVDFYPHGGIRRCVLNGDHRVYTEQRVAVVCADGRDATLHPDGTLRSCTLREPARLDGTACAAGSRLVLAADGRLEGCRAGAGG